MSRKKNPNSRWVKGNKRYPENVDLSKYIEPLGWSKGARVRKRQQ